MENHEQMWVEDAKRNARARQQQETVPVVVRMFAYHNDTMPPYRVVELPKEKYNRDNPEQTLEAVFHYGQNDFQSLERCCSVSMGDVIYLTPTDPWMVKAMGFRRVSHQEVQEIERIPRDERWSYLIASC